MQPAPCSFARRTTLLRTHSAWQPRSENWSCPTACCRRYSPSVPSVPPRNCSDPECVQCPGKGHNQRVARGEQSAVVQVRGFHPGFRGCAKEEQLSACFQLRPRVREALRACPPLAAPVAAPVAVHTQHSPLRCMHPGFATSLVGWQTGKQTTRGHSGRRPCVLGSCGPFCLEPAVWAVFGGSCVPRVQVFLPRVAGAGILRPVWDPPARSGILWPARLY